MIGLQPFDPGSIALIALLNPAVAVVGYAMGRSADQPQKILIAAFAASAAGSVLIWLATFLKIMPARGMGGEAGIFVLQMAFGLAWATLGYYLKPRTK